VKRRGADDGFTLIELVFTIVIMGVLTIPLGNFILAYFQNYTTTEARISGSHDVQIATAYFSQDVANTGLRGATSPYAPQQSVWTATSGFPATYCGQGLGSPVLLLRWDDWAASGNTGVSTGPHSAVYFVANGALHRAYCASGTTVVSAATVVHNYASATVSCSSSCGGSTPPATITLTVDINSSGDAQTVNLTGQRRQS
jgi:prepilin-type N-terminal cleavage/methylation domain-containing protein